MDRDLAQLWREDGRNVADYDGIVVLEAASEDKLREFFQSKDYLEKLARDEEKFTERTTISVFPTRVINMYDATE